MSCPPSALSGSESGLPPWRRHLPSKFLQPLHNCAPKMPHLGVCPLEGKINGAFDSPTHRLVFLRREHRRLSNRCRGWLAQNIKASSTVQRRGLSRHNSMVPKVCFPAVPTLVIFLPTVLDSEDIHVLLAVADNRRSVNPQIHMLAVNLASNFFFFKPAANPVHDCQGWRMRFLLLFESYCSQQFHL